VPRGQRADPASRDHPLPFFLNPLRPEEVRVLWRDEAGHTRAQRDADLPGVVAFVEEGARLGHLRLEGQLGVGDPLVNQGGPTRPAKKIEGIATPMTATR